MRSAFPLPYPSHPPGICVSPGIIYSDAFSLFGALAFEFDSLSLIYQGETPRPLPRRPQMVLAFRLVLGKFHIYSDDSGAISGISALGILLLENASGPILLIGGMWGVGGGVSAAFA